MRRGLVKLLPVLTLIACEQPVAPLDYQGQALASYDGSVRIAPGVSVDDSLAVAVLWVTNDDVGVRPDKAAVSRVNPAATSALGRFELSVFEPPPAIALQPSNASPLAGFAVGYLVAYEDKNGNGQLDLSASGDANDMLVGASPNALVMYAERDWPDSEPALFSYPHMGSDGVKVPHGHPGIRPKAGWALAHAGLDTDEYSCSTTCDCLDASCEQKTCHAPECTALPVYEARPVIRDWLDGDEIELDVVGDISKLSRSQVRNVVRPDVD